MTLLRQPGIPKPNPYYMFHQRQILDDWKPFIPWES